MLNKNFLSEDFLLQQKNISLSLYPDLNNGIILIEPNSSINPIEWSKSNRDFIERSLLQYGGLLLRGFNIHSISEFNKFSQVICQNLSEYTYRSTPRSNLGGRIYTATEYPADQSIPLHNENAYSDSWPEKILFFCAIPAKEGGETPIADSRKILKRLNKKIVKKFDDKGVLYIRNYFPEIDLSWQDVFQTNNKEDVEKYCYNHSIQYSWNKEGPELTTRQKCQATLLHPVTKEKVWFNQAHLFHISNLNQELIKTLITEIGKENLPRNSFYGDGSPIEEEVLNHIRKVYEQEMIIFRWQRGDIMILDNILMCHGRNSYSGERKIAVAMG